MSLLYIAAPLIELFYRANVRIFLWLHHYFAAHSTLYKLGLFLTNRGADLLVLATLLLLWFWPRNEQSRALFSDASFSDASFSDASVGAERKSSAWLRNLGARLAYEDASIGIVTREQSRAQTLILALSCVTIYLFVRLIAFQWGITRPVASYWMGESPVSLSGAARSLWQPGSFPSDYAAVLAAFCTALFFWNRRLAWCWICLALVIGICLVALGFHYPFDMFAGAALGIIGVWFPLNAYKQRGGLYVRANDFARAFDLQNAPYCYLLYFLVLIAGFEALAHFEHLVDFLFAVRGALLQSWGR